MADIKNKEQIILNLPIELLGNLKREAKEKGIFLNALITQKVWNK